MEKKKIYYSISEVATELNVNASSLRFWETEFSDIKPHKNKKGNRFYTQEDIILLKKIYHLTKECGYTLEGTREKLKIKDSTFNQKIEAINKLEAIKTRLETIKSNF